MWDDFKINDIDYFGTTLGQRGFIEELQIRCSMKVLKIFGLSY